MTAAFITRDSRRCLLPITVVPYEYDGQTYDIDFNSEKEGNSSTKSTYAAITARSYHAGGLVTTGFLDGSTRTISNTIDLAVWRALGTADGDEILPGDY